MTISAEDVNECKKNLPALSWTNCRKKKCPLGPGEPTRQWEDDGEWVLALFFV